MEFYSSLDASQLDADTPTLFEVISSRQLEALLSPSIRYLLVHYATRYPSYLLRLTNRFDELNLVIRSAIEYYFLTKHHGSFTESFYGLKRVNATALSLSQYNNLLPLVPLIVESKRRLTSLQHLVSLFEITGSQYVSEKLEYCYEVWYPKMITRQLEITDNLSPREKLRIRAKRAFVSVYPYMIALVRSADFLCTIGYLGGSTRSPSLLSYLFGIGYARSSQFDSKPTKKPSQSRQDRTGPVSNLEFLLRFIIKKFSLPLWKLVKLVLSTVFPLGIFSIKFFEWWSNSGFSSKILKSLAGELDFTLPNPLTVYKGSTKSSRSTGLCRLCEKPITNPAIIETGYVFDYTCIYEYLAKSHIIIAERIPKEHEFSDVESDDESALAEGATGQAVKLGGRCPVTGKRLLGCKWNDTKQEWDIEGIRRVIL